MMIGPEPMMRMRWMSVRLGMLHQLYEIVEEVPRVMRTGSGFRMILDAKHGMIAQPEAFESLVVQIHVSDLALARAERIGIHGESVIVRSYFHFIGDLVDDRVIGAAVAELHLVCLAAYRKTQNLIAEADAEDRNLADEALHVAHLGPQRFGVARAVR